MKTKTKWNLKLLYKGDTDPHIEKDLKEIESGCLSFEKKYKNKNFTASPTTLAKAFHEYEQLSVRIDGRKPWWYFVLKTHLNSNDTKSSAAATKCEQRITEATNKIAFFILDVAKISVKKQKIFLKDGSLKPYSYALMRIFQGAQYNLSEGEEQLENLLSNTSYAMWIETQQRLLNNQVVRHKGKDIPIAQAVAQLSDMPKKDRHDIHTKTGAVLKSISHMAEGEINAIYNYKKVMDTRRGYKKPYSATIIGYENNEKSIEAFVSLVSKHFNISQRFFRLHKKLLGGNKITLADRGVKIGKIRTTFDFETSVSILRAMLSRIDPEYVEMFNMFLENGHIDVYPKKGKKAGAYCWGMGHLPTFLLLNHVNDVGSLQTLAHEMGHAIHTELSKKQPPRYQKYSTATAEVASTFFEQAVSEEIEKRLSDKEKVVMLHNRIVGDVATIFRQIACFNFENELHKKIGKEGQVSKEDIAHLMSKHLKSYVGGAVDVTEDDGYFYVYWSHIRRFFYVYTYAYGQLISRALYEKTKQDPAYTKKIRQFLSAGRSMSPENIFKMIGIDTSKASFFEAGLQSIEKDITKLERLSGK